MGFRAQIGFRVSWISWKCCNLHCEVSVKQQFCSWGWHIMVRSSACAVFSSGNQKHPLPLLVNLAPPPGNALSSQFSTTIQWVAHREFFKCKWGLFSRGSCEEGAIGNTFLKRGS